jgi:hypothetical protein
MNDLETKLLGSTIDLKLNTYDSSGGSVTATNLDADAIRIYKNGSATQRTSAAGITVTVDFGSVTGAHKIRVDSSDNSDDGFYEADSFYEVMAVGITVDGQTVNPWVGSFRLSSKPNVDDLNDFNPSSDTVARVTLTDTCTTNTDMRGTDSALTDKSNFALSTASISSILSALNAGTYGNGSTFSALMNFIEALALGNIEITNADTSTPIMLIKDAAGNTLATFTLTTTGSTKGSRTLST